MYGSIYSFSEHAKLFLVSHTQKKLLKRSHYVLLKKSYQILAICAKKIAMLIFVFQKKRKEKKTFYNNCTVQIQTQSFASIASPGKSRLSH